MTPRVSVLVPSYGRPESLTRCLAALGAQTRAPDEVVVGVRTGDDATVAVVEAARATGLPVHVATVAAAGVVASMQAALEAATGDIVALTDDDARPFPAWIDGLLAHFQSAPNVGGVGGRDWQPYERGNARRVGVVQWFGRVIGNHHLGAGPARDVDVLKGVNCSFRAPLLRAVGFDGRLRGTGAQVHWELGVCLPLRRAGWRLVYDPAVAVDHDLAPRLDADLLHRGHFSVAPMVDAVHNESVTLGSDRSWGWRLLHLTWALVIGTFDAPGVLQLLREPFGAQRPIRSLAWAVLCGRFAGLRTLHRQPRPVSIPTA